MPERSSTPTEKPRELRGDVLRLYAEDVAALRADGSDQKAFDRIVTACEAWVEVEALGPLTRDDDKDIVSAAIAEVLIDLKSEEVPFRQLCDRLQGALGEQIQQRESELELLQPLSQCSAKDLQVPSPSQGDTVYQFWLEVVQTIEGFILPALVSLAPRDQDLIIASYRLDELRDPTRPPEILTFASAEEKERDLAAARCRFNALLEENLLLGLALAQKDSSVLAAALRVVRGHALDRALAIVREGRSE